MSTKKITNFFKTTSTSVSATASTASDSLKRKHELETEDSQIIDNQLENVVHLTQKNDIGLFLNRCLSDHEKNIVLTNLWSPQANYLFPLLNNNAKRNIKFQQRWLDKFNWLSYSEKLEGAFCKYCVVFAKFGGKGSQALGSLVTQCLVL